MHLSIRWIVYNLFCINIIIYFMIHNDFCKLLSFHTKKNSTGFLFHLYSDFLTITNQTKIAMFPVVQVCKSNFLQ